LSSWSFHGDDCRGCIKGLALPADTTISAKFFHGDNAVAASKAENDKFVVGLGNTVSMANAVGASKHDRERTADDWVRSYFHGDRGCIKDSDRFVSSA
jgi:hypothetical protein